MADSFLTEPIAKFLAQRKRFHRHRYDISGAEEIKVDLTGGNHPAFLVLKCKCGKSMVFPEENFKLALRDGTENTKKILASLNLEE